MACLPSVSSVPLGRKAIDRQRPMEVTRGLLIFAHFCPMCRLGLPSNWLNMNYIEPMNTKVRTASMTLAGVAVLVTGCAERQVAYVPVYQAQPAYVVQQPYPPPVAYQVQPAPAQPPAPAAPAAAPAAPTADWSAPAAAPAPMPAQPLPPQPPQTVVVAPAAPPPPLVEVIPVAPNPYYVWTSGYWAWNGRWVWIGGRWVVRPRPTAVWVGGHWSRHAHGYVWIGGGWR
jgi:WXXGXW repeat (2 copies)